MRPTLENVLSLLFPTMDTRMQNFWKESIGKEMTLRFAWHLRYSKEYAKKYVNTRPKDPSNPFAGPLESLSDRIRKLEKESRRPEKDILEREKSPLLKASADNCAVTDMRPPTASTRSLLYNGISAQGAGRYAYLKKRQLVTPDKKYVFPILSSNEYGWKIMEYAKPERSLHGHASVIRDNFYRSSGVSLA